jgi:hypothetical protein
VQESSEIKNTEQEHRERSTKYALRFCYLLKVEKINIRVIKKGRLKRARIIRADEILRMKYIDKNS